MKDERIATPPAPPFRKDQEQPEPDQDEQERFRQFHMELLREQCEQM